MKVSLISITEMPKQVSKDLLNDWDSTPEQIIVYTARVSNPSNAANMETAPRLLKYLIDHHHWSPFEMVDVTVEIETSVAIAAQLLRHRSFVFQQFSARYADVGDLGFERILPRRQDIKNRQNSTDDLDEYDMTWFDDQLRYVQNIAEVAYSEALRMGIAKESARFLLPQSKTTRLYMKGSCRSWIHYLNVRLDPSTQREHRDVAEAIRAVFVSEFPETSKALGWVLEKPQEAPGWDADGREV